MIPDWDTIQAVWPLLLGLAGLWARIEVALSKGASRSRQHEREIARLEVKVEARAAPEGIGSGRVSEDLPVEALEGSAYPEQAFLDAPELHGLLRGRTD